ncbi:nuclear factor 7, ovary-like [Engraulis encrasicolus]|uniref:nuclear factor 7, ovary-like n=1 Tax=Engraulis encrasicolus TaxID=184585 RepID=UPI002FD11273
MDSEVLEENLTCTICYGIFTDPVVLKCSHTFCQECIRQYWKGLNVLLCPVCRKECSSEEPTESLAFKSLCESVRKRTETVKPVDQPDQLCPLHGKKVKLFCFDDKQPICVSCHTSERHEKHNCVPIEEAVEELKKEMSKDLPKFIESQKTLGKAESDLQKIATDMQEQARYMEFHIREEFKKRHEYLCEQERAKIQELTEERNHKDMMIQNEIKKIRNHVADVMKTIDEIKQRLKSDDILFLKTYSQPHRFQCAKPKPFNLNNMVRHIRFQSNELWGPSYNLREQPVVLLDPNTVSANLLLSGDLTSLLYTEEKLKRPKNPQRLHVGVLGSIGFSTGRHCWDVVVGRNEKWTLGVVRQSFQHNTHREMDPDHGEWTIHHINGNYFAGKMTRTVLHMACKHRPRVIRMVMNCPHRMLTFMDPKRDLTLYSFDHVSGEMLFPYFNTRSSRGPLRICFSQQL